MNYFFYVEDSKSGREMFEYLIRTMLKKHTRVRNIWCIERNNYVVESGFGYPSMLGINSPYPNKNRLGITIDEINLHGGVDCLVLCLDTDGDSESKTKRVERSIKEYHNKLRCPHKVFVQNICAETWMLGIDTLFPSVYNASFEPYARHYNVRKHDPEKMDKPPDFPRTLALYHFEYLREMARQSAIIVNKSSCKPLFRKNYMNRLINRVDGTNHLPSLARFIDFLRECT